MKVALYARVSTVDQDERLQLPRLRQVAELRGYTVVGEYTDEASGRDANRPGWKALLSDARAGSWANANRYYTKYKTIDIPNAKKEALSKLAKPKPRTAGAKRLDAFTKPKKKVAKKAPKKKVAKRPK